MICVVTIYDRFSESTIIVDGRKQKTGGREYQAICNAYFTIPNAKCFANWLRDRYRGRTIVLTENGRTEILRGYNEKV